LFLEKALELMVTVGASDGLVKESCGKLFTGVKSPWDRLRRPATRSMLQGCRVFLGLKRGVMVELIRNSMDWISDSGKNEGVNSGKPCSEGATQNDMDRDSGDRSGARGIAYRDN
jgi:hypothetical protein